MFLKSIELTNFRCFKHLHLDFFSTETEVRQRTVLLGENSTGKSTILKAISLVLLGSNTLGELIGNPSDWIRFGEEECEVKIVMNTNTEEGVTATLYLVIHRGDTLRNVIGRNRRTLEFVDKARNELLVMGYGVSRRLGSSSDFTKNGSQAGNVATLFNRNANLISLEEWAIDMDYKDEKKGLDLVKKVINKFLPEVTFKGIDKQKKQLLFKTKDGVIPLEYLSDGYQNIAAWLGDMLYRITDENTHSYSQQKTLKKSKKISPLKKEGILLIDEIGLHLHPKWQRQLLDFIHENFPKIQLIATTHSPFIAQQLDENELFTLKRNTSNDIELIQFEQPPNQLLIHQVVMSDMFGLETDESLETEQLKNTYDVLNDKENLSENDKKKLKKVEQQLQELPVNIRQNTFYDEEYMQLLKDINKEIKKDKE